MNKLNSIREILGLQTIPHYANKFNRISLMFIGSQLDILTKTLNTSQASFAGQANIFYLIKYLYVYDK